MRRLSFMDKWFLLAESRETPEHVGALYLFTLPEGEDEAGFVDEQLAILRSPKEWRRPFGDRIKTGPLGPAGPTTWVPDENLDVDYHVRHTVLPEHEELLAFVARLHEPRLDRDRPLWETHLIRGLPGRRFALYQKTHHAAIDGVSGVRISLEMMSADPEERRDYSPFSRHAEELTRRRRAEREPPTQRELEMLRDRLGPRTGLLAELRTYARAWFDEKETLPTAWRDSPKTSLGAKITARRQIVTHSCSLPRVRALGEALGGTINDVVLAMCGGALRRLLAAQGDVPEQPLMAMVPVSLRTEDRGRVGNAVGALVANLGTNIADPAARFQTVDASMNEGKALLRGMSPKEIELFTLITLTPGMLAGVLGFGHRFSPYSVVVSNVRGPKEQRYWNGARLESFYPLGGIYHGYGLNITLLSNADRLDFGILACPDTVPHAQRLGDELSAALEDLERAAGL